MRPEDDFTRRVFVTGNFYPADTTVVSDVLLGYQLQQLALNLGLRLGSTEFSAEEFQELAHKITDETLKGAEEVTGFSRNGGKYALSDKTIQNVGHKLGKAGRQSFKGGRGMDLFVYLLQFTAFGSLLLLGHHLDSVLGAVLGGISGLVLAPIINWLWISRCCSVFNKRIFS